MAKLARRVRARRLFAVQAGQVYRWPSHGPSKTHWRYLRVVRVHRSKVRQPTITACEITRTGTLAQGMSRMGFSKSVPHVVGLTWNDAQWGLPNAFERWIELEKENKQ